MRLDSAPPATFNLTKKIYFHIYKIQMSDNIKNSALLSSWKEIASYLDCDIRTAYRWEEKYSLPIHRIEGAPKSRVYAYKHELDEWLRAKFDNHSVPPQKKPRIWLSKKSLLILSASLVLAAALLGLYFFILKSGNQTPPLAQGVPQSTGPLVMKDSDIITTEFAGNGRIRIWRKDRANSYQEVWRIEPLRHTSLAVGNIDEEADNEIVAPNLCRVTEKRGEREVSRFKFFINVYKQGEKNTWRSTYESDEDCVFEDKDFLISEVAIGNVDGEPGNEIVLITQNCLAIFKYDPKEDRLKLVRSRYSLLEGRSLFIKSVVVENIDDDEIDEIIIAADHWTGTGMVVNKGYIFLLKVQDDWPRIYRTIGTGANLSYQSLRIGDVIPGGGKEIISPGYRKESDVWNTFILGWNSSGEKVIDRPVYDFGQLQSRMVHLDVGDLDGNPGDEVIIGHHAPDELIAYFWNGSDLIEGTRYPLDAKVALSNVYIVNSKDKSDALSEVIVCGGYGRASDPAGNFYLEILGFNDGFFSKWKRTGGEKGELNVSYAALAKRRN